MKIALDVGNSHVTVGLFDAEGVIEAGRVETTSFTDRDDGWSRLESIVAGSNRVAEPIEGVIIASVVPAATSILVMKVREQYQLETLLVGPHLELGIQMTMKHPEEVGADRIVNAAAARELYGSPVIAVDLGTAITFDVVDGKGDFLGGAIAPGVGTSSASLAHSGAQLFATEPRFPHEAIGATTDEALRSGILFGAAALIDGMVARMIAELEGDEVTVIATGGYSSLVAPHASTITAVDSMLTLKGLMLIAEMNR